MNKAFLTFLKYLLPSVFILSHFATYAADADGKFAVKGAGKRSCNDFVQAADEKSSDFLLYGGWLEGYLSHFNSNQENTTS